MRPIPDSCPVSGICCLLFLFSCCPRDQICFQHEGVCIILISWLEWMRSQDISFTCVQMCFILHSLSLSLFTAWRCNRIYRYKHHNTRTRIKPFYLLTEWANECYAWRSLECCPLLCHSLLSRHVWSVSLSCLMPLFIPNHHCYLLSLHQIVKVSHSLSPHSFSLTLTGLFLPDQEARRKNSQAADKVDKRRQVVA